MAKRKILFIDDEENILSSLKRILRKSPYDIFTTSDPNEVFRLLKSQEFSVLVSDQKMPTLQGTDILKRAKEIAPDTIRIMLTGYADINSAILAVNDGSIFRFLTKPWNEDSLLGAIGQAVHQFDLIDENRCLLALTKKQNEELKSWNTTLEKKVEERTQEVFKLNKQLEKAFFESVKVMGSLAELNSQIVGGHSKRVARMSGCIAKELGLNEKETFQVQVAAYLHDIGKIGLSKIFNPKEAEMELHPERGAQIVSQVPNIEKAALFIKHHHELFDGSGYPENLSSEKIPIGSRIIAVADAYDKSLHLRSGFESQTPTKVLQELKTAAGKQFDPVVISALSNYLSSELQLKSENFEVEIELFELSEGMILSRPLETKQGRVMLGADFKIDKTILERLWKHHLEDPFKNEIFIYRRSIPKSANSS